MKIICPVIQITMFTKVCADRYATERQAPSIINLSCAGEAGENAKHAYRIGMGIHSGAENKWFERREMLAGEVRVRSGIDSDIFEASSSPGVEYASMRLTAAQIGNCSSPAGRR